MTKQYQMRFWWMLLLRGLAALIFAYLAFFWTNLTLELLVVFFGIYMLIDGMFGVASAVLSSESFKNWWYLLIEGLFGVLIGSIAFIFPINTVLIFFYVISFWILVTGMLEIWAAYKINWGAIGKWFMLFVGILSIVVAVVMLLNPLETLEVIIWLLGIYSLIFGIGMTIFAFTFKNHKLLK